MGVFLLWTVAFVLADETNAEVTTGDTAGISTTAEVTTGDTAGISTTAETTTGDTAEISTTVETTTGDTAEISTTVETTTWDTAEVDTTEVTTWDTAEEIEAQTVTLTISDVAKEKYSEEQISAYTWAFENGITTINDIEKARLNAGLTRAQLAKMMSQYMTNVLWKTPAEAEKVEYVDVDESLGDLADYIQTAYAYKIMWINADGTPIKKFNPKGQVTRAEYATVFSRVLFGDKYNKSEWKYYENHLKALKEAWILTNDNPGIKEVRGWVMLMMYRSVSAKSEIPVEEVSEEITWSVIGMANPASVYCEEQGGTVTIVKDENWNEYGICKLADGTEVEEWEYYRLNHQDESETTSWNIATWAKAPLYTEEDLRNAEKLVINEGFGNMTVKVENVKITYMWDEKAISELNYCKEFEWDMVVEECAVFESEFFIPEQDVEMAGAFEPNKTLTGYLWYLGRTKGGEWKILTMGY